jgi:anti-anti-sigma factor
MLATASRLDRAEFVLDVSNLEFFDGAIVDVFLKFHRYLALQSRRLVLRGVSPTTARILDICEVSHVLTTIYAPAAPAEILLTGVVA